MRLHRALCASGLLAMFTACALPPPDNPVADSPGAGAQGPVDGAAAPATSPGRATAKTYRAGAATVESAAVVSLSSFPSAAAGATGAATMAYRLRMADGTAQDVVQTGERFQPGERVQLTGDGRLVRP